MEEQTNFSIDELDSLLETFDNMNNPKIQNMKKRGFKKPHLPIDNLSFTEAKIITINHLFNQKGTDNQKLSFTIDNIIDKEYLECPECGKRMYYFSYYERFGCPKCLYTTDKMIMEKNTPIVRTRKGKTNE